MGGVDHATQPARGNGGKWVWLPFRYSHLGTADKHNNLIQFQSLVSIRDDVQNVTRGSFVLKTAGGFCFFGVQSFGSDHQSSPFRNLDC